MIGFFSNLVFMNPWILAGLAALPGLYWLLRIMPPAPKFIILPTARFLKDLQPETHTPSHTPWWILLLRLLIAALVLIALAAPVYNPAGQLAGSGPVRIVIDNGWSAAQNWNSILKTAEEIATQAAREGREIYILRTAAQSGEETLNQQGPLSSDEALSVIRGMKPQAWPSDNEKASQAAQEAMDSYWLGGGIDEGNAAALAQKLSGLGSLHYYAPAPAALPILLLPSEEVSSAPQIEILAPGIIPSGTQTTLQAVSQDGKILDSKDVALIPEKMPMSVAFDIPESLHGELGSFRVAGLASAGSVYLLDERYRKRSVGVFGDAGESAPLTEAGYYLRRALEPYAALETGNIHALLEKNPSVIILPDAGSLPADQMDALESWVRKGGVLLRFAGPNMTRSEGEIFLTPTPLRKGGRALDGSMTWEQPQKIAPFAEGSPFYGLKVPEDIEVRQQILPEPAPDLDEKTWARLSDGTPLVTAAPMDRGLLVFVHTTATPEWSGLPLSGLYVDMLRRIVSMSGGSFESAKNGGGALEPLVVLDGFGAAQAPGGAARALQAQDIASTAPSPVHPPGIYGNSSFRQAFNLGDAIESMKAARVADAQTYGASYEKNLMAPILYAALILLFADWFVMLLIAAGLKPFWHFAALVFLLLPLQAQAQSADDLKRADGLYLAYVRSGDPAIDSASERGLAALSDVLKQRTAVEPAGVAGVSPEEELAFYPLLYWPVSPAQTALSPKAARNVQDYLEHGGTILFDTRDAHYSGESFAETANGAALRRMLVGLGIPPLAPAAKDHVLTKSFYLLDSFPGKYDGPLWVEGESANGRDGVSPVIIGGNDWAGAWAAGRGDRYELAGGARQQEMASRFGVNLVMYALTGNYKADQVHVPYILERLGR